MQLDDIKNLITATGIVSTSNQHNSAQQLRKMISDNLMVSHLTEILHGHAGLPCLGRNQTAQMPVPREACAGCSRFASIHCTGLCIARVTAASAKLHHSFVTTKRQLQYAFLALPSGVKFPAVGSTNSGTRLLLLPCLWYNVPDPYCMLMLSCLHAGGCIVEGNS